MIRFRAPIKVSRYSMPDRVYLDWNATTPLRPEAREAMAAAWDLLGNPSSVHAEGRQARRLVEEARASVAGAVGALAAQRRFHLGWNRGQCAGADAGASARIRSSGPEVAGFGHRARLGARRRAVSGRGHRHRRRHALGFGGSGPSARNPRRRTSHAGLGDAGQQRNRRGAADFWRSPKSSTKRAGSCTSTRFRRSEKYPSISRY